jgi:mercuric reductase
MAEKFDLVILGSGSTAFTAAIRASELAMALRFGATVQNFIDMIHVYPTMSESLKIVALSFFKDVEKRCAE